MQPLFELISARDTQVLSVRSVDMMSINTQVILMIIVMAGLSIGLNAQSRNNNLPTVPSLDLQRYAGKWYEIARYPNRFQKQCAGNVTANYTLTSGGGITVINECLKSNGKMDRAKGKAKIADKQTNAKLKVRFAPAAISFLPFVWGDYWVLELGPNYEYSMIGEPGRDYFWILSRTPTMDESLYNALLERARSMGFEPNRVVRTPQGMISGE